MSRDHEIGRAAFQRGYVATPKANNWQANQKRDAGWDHQKYSPPPAPPPAPAPRPVQSGTGKKY